MNSNQQPSSLLPGQQVVHVAQDSDTDLEALFNSVMNPKPSSWRKKLLPESFFKEPDSGSHSRQSSTDSTSQQQHPPRLQVSHTRSHSSPASLQLGLPPAGTPSPGGPPQSHHQHQRHQSFDVAEELPLPPGWEMAYTSNGQKYFLNHIEKITTWVDPRKSLAPNMAAMSLHHNPPNHPHSQPQRSMALSQPNLGDLPAGWEQAVSPQGETYYIDHKTHSTSWLHPKLLLQQHHQQSQPHQHPPPQHHHHLQQQQQMQAQQVPAQALSSPGSLAPQHNSAAAMMSLGGPLVAGASGVSGASSVQGGVNAVGVSQQQKMRLQRIHLERERIQRRQEELMRQEVALCRQLPMEGDNLGSSLTPAGASQNNMPANSSDPFLNSGHFHHSREQSSDSGLGLGCYSIPTTPEDFLNNMEEMDTGESLVQGTLNIPGGAQPSRFPDFLDSLPGTNVDLGTLEGSDLMPILNDVESVLNKAEPFLTWL